MNDDHEFELATQAWLDEGSDQTPPSTIDAVLLAVRTTSQERDLGIPWRTAPMSTPMRLLAAIAVILIAGVGALALLGRSAGVGGVGGVGGGPSPIPSIAAASPAPTPYAIDFATWQSYTSTRYGFSIGHPADWHVTHSAIRDWAFPADANADGTSPAVETFANVGQSIATSAWSVAVLPGTTADTWLQAYCLKAESDNPCAGLASQTIAATMDGHAGSLVAFAQDTQSFFLVGNRMYVVAIWQAEDFIPGGVSRLLEAYLSTMHLLPGGPAPSATTPRPS